MKINEGLWGDRPSCSIGVRLGDRIPKCCPLPAIPALTRARSLPVSVQETLEVLIRIRSLPSD